jgi:hypothetical protein
VLAFRPGRGMMALTIGVAGLVAGRLDVISTGLVAQEVEGRLVISEVRANAGTGWATRCSSGWSFSTRVGAS